MDEVIEHIDPARLEDASGPARRSMLEHLRGCAACRQKIGASDPSALFGLLALAPMPAQALNEVSAEVERQLESQRRVNVWPRSVAAAAIFTLTLLTGYVTLRDQPVAPEQAQQKPRRADVDVGGSAGVSSVIDLTVGDTQLVMVYNGDLDL